MRNKKFRKHLYRIESSMEKLCNAVLKQGQEELFQELVCRITTFKMNQYGSDPLEEDTLDPDAKEYREVQPSEMTLDEAVSVCLNAGEDNKPVNQSPPDED